jgi:hypothetical protein
MTNEIDFDALARKANGSNGSIEDRDALYPNVFALPQWHFIARDHFPRRKSIYRLEPAGRGRAEYDQGVHRHGSAAAFCEGTT